MNFYDNQYWFTNKGVMLSRENGTETLKAFWMILYGSKISLQSQECVEVEEGGVWRSFVKADTHLVILTNKLLHPTATENRRVNKHMGGNFLRKLPLRNRLVMTGFQLPWMTTMMNSVVLWLKLDVTKTVAVSYTGTDTILIFTAVITVVIY